MTRLGPPMSLRPPPEVRWWCYPAWWLTVYTMTPAAHLIVALAGAAYAFDAERRGEWGQAAVGGWWFLASATLGHTVLVVRRLLDEEHAGADAGGGEGGR